MADRQIYGYNNKEVELKNCDLNFYPRDPENPMSNNARLFISTPNKRVDIVFDPMKLDNPVSDNWVRYLLRNCPKMINDYEKKAERFKRTESLPDSSLSKNISKFLGLAYLRKNRMNKAERNLSNTIEMAMRGVGSLSKNALGKRKNSYIESVSIEGQGFTLELGKRNELAIQGVPYRLPIDDRDNKQRLDLLSLGMTKFFREHDSKEVSQHIETMKTLFEYFDIERSPVLSDVLIVGPEIELLPIEIQIERLERENIVRSLRRHEGEFTAVRTRAGRDTNFACRVPKDIQFTVKTSWADLSVNRPSIDHGEGDFLVCSEKNGKPDFDNVWVVNGKEFENKYRIRQKVREWV